MNEATISQIQVLLHRREITLQTCDVCVCVHHSGSQGGGGEFLDSGNARAVGTGPYAMPLCQLPQTENDGQPEEAAETFPKIKS